MDDWSLMGEPATEMDAMDSAKDSSGFGPWVVKKQWLQTWMDWDEDHCSGASCELSEYKILSKRPDVRA